MFMRKVGKIRYRKAFLVLGVILIVAGSALAQSDPIGMMDVVYLDSVEAGPGQDVAIRVSLRNDEELNSLSVPITYNTDLLRLKSVSFEGSRLEYLETKILNPDEVSEIDGHFVVAAIQILEAPIAPGDGLAFIMLFTVSDSAVSGEVADIDTLFYPPGGKLMLVATESSTTIEPVFISGKVSVGDINHSPQFAPVVKQYVLEGDSLILDVNVNDPDGDSLVLAVTNKPSGAFFVDGGDGTARFTWVPTYVGPTSADGSPFTVSFWASDGDISIEQQVQVEVINANRAPVIVAPTEVSVDAGKTLSFEVRAQDPDFEQVVWSWQSELVGASFTGDNPGTFVWTSQLTDTGITSMSFVASDPQGFSDTAIVSVTVNPATIYVLALDTVEVFPGDQFTFEAFLDNMVPVGGFNILFSVDPSVFSILSVSNIGTRSESFEYFTYIIGENSVPGDIRIIGTADFENVNPLAAGSGAVARLQVRASGDIMLSGMTIPVRFRFLDAPTNNDNTLTDTTGLRVEQQDIQYTDGLIKFADIGEINIGDINLNGLAAEIADVIYFTNYFIDPKKYPLNILQYANSDVNNDGLVATISDLVYLINWVINGTPGKPSVAEVDLTAQYEIDAGDNTFRYETESDIGAVFVRFETESDLSQVLINNLTNDMTLTYSTHEDGLRVLVYSLEGAVLSAGNVDLFTVEGIDGYRVAEVEMSSDNGRQVTVAMSSTEKRLPNEFALHQNYPNPFNPQTEISFDIAATSHARLCVYNVLGQAVRTLADGMFSAGSYTVTWDGTDESGQSVASGIYLYRLEAGEQSVSKKMMLLK